MNRDILYKEEDFVFSYRVAGVLMHHGCVLLQKPAGDDGYSFIGGHVAAMEQTKQTLVREFCEEIRADIIVDELMAVGEVFFPWGNRPCHQIALYFRVHLADETQIPLTGTFHGVDDLGGERVNLDFTWLPAHRLGQETVYPSRVAELIAQGKEGIVHFVDDQLKND